MTILSSLGSRSRLSDAAVPWADESEAQGSRNWPQLIEKEERGSHQVCLLPALQLLITNTRRCQTVPRFETLDESYPLQPADNPSEITKRIYDAKMKLGRVMSVAAFSLAEVTYAVGGDIGYQVQESAKSARFRLATKQDNVSGVLLPRYESYVSEGNKDFGLTGLGKGGQQVQKCRETYARAVEALVELATLQVRVMRIPCRHFTR